MARKMLVALFHMLRDNLPYRAPDQQPIPDHLKERIANRLATKLKALGYAVTLAAQPAVS
jgi:hypothetical protein